MIALSPEIELALWRFDHDRRVQLATRQKLARQSSGIDVRAMIARALYQLADRLAEPQPTARTSRVGG